jgi:cyclic beta-1,2-glucan synthetase
MDITRWREDSTRDCWGQYCYIRNIDEGRAWSAGRQPLGRNADEYEVDLRSDRAIIRRRDDDVETCYEVAVVPDVDAEVRRITLTNRCDRPRTLEVTSYAEVALNSRRADQAHPSFAKLFLETEYYPLSSALFCRRRPRAHDQKPVWALQVLASEVSGKVEYETDRARFLGRGRSTQNPVAMEGGVALSGTVGSVLDPIFSLRKQIRVEPGVSSVLAFTTAAPEDRAQAKELAARFASLQTVDRVFEEAIASDVTRRAELGLTPDEAALFQRLAALVLFANPSLRSCESVVRNRLGQPGLWPHGISGDVPIALVRIGADRNLGLVREVLQAHAHWRRCGLVADLVFLQDDGIGNEMRHQLEDLVRNAPTAELVDRSGGVFLRDASRMSADDATVLEAAARLLLRGGDGPLTAQLGRALGDAPPLPSAPLPLGHSEELSPKASLALGGSPTPGAELLFHNGLGGFSADGREYVITLHAGERPPAPWINVLANPDFGCLVTEAGCGCTWAGNSQMNRLTPWSNDPVTDPPGEAVYLRDEDTGEFWSPTPAPCGGEATTVVRHGQGYSLFTRTSHDLEQDLLILISPTDQVKIFRLRVRNTRSKPRHLSATFYAEWVLGSLRDDAALHVVCSADAETGALFATNAWAGDFAGKVAFAAVAAIHKGTPLHSFTTDRAEFLGREGCLEAPAALRRSRLSGRAGTLVDPCAALMTQMEVPSGEEEEVVFLLGQAGTPEEVRQLVRSYASPARVEAVVKEARALWDRILGKVQVQTPDAAMDLMLNRWLMYQALACRMWGRSAFYQSGGAFGFRDQLQDSMAVVYGAPEEARAQILRAASRQFEEGDVQHWWHPPAGRGVRTRISDDLVFLPLVVSHYVGITGDASLLDEPVPFLQAPVLRPDQEEDYGLPEVSPKFGSVYEHCERALEYGLKLGPHGLPLMGTGDWNDGMNKVGAEGKGESVWNGWFMLATLREFAGLAEQRRDGGRAVWCRERAELLRVALEEQAWDGRWYRRAYFDDGTPLGSTTNDECKIDSIAQSWAVISGGGDSKRVREAMAAVEEHLVRNVDSLILLFTPPFDCGHLEPGYIKGYVPGIRENGGQYTHAATWVVLATALLGHGQRAAELFDMLNPVRRTDSPDRVERYKVEPYVVCADVYGAPPHTGRGGWTWYTGSAAWLYRVGLEAILGFRLRGTRLEFDPCVPIGWSGYKITYRYRSATYHVVIENPEGAGRGVREVTFDGLTLQGSVVELLDDGRLHEVKISLGS